MSGSLLAKETHMGMPFSMHSTSTRQFYQSWFLRGLRDVEKAIG
jgi:hypothetical protein